MNTYIAFYRKNKIEVKAQTSYDAQRKAAKEFGAKKSYEVSIVLSEMSGRNIPFNCCNI